jgi:hypothetical protein
MYMVINIKCNECLYNIKQLRIWVKGRLNIILQVLAIKTKNHALRPNILTLDLLNMPENYTNYHTVTQHKSKDICLSFAETWPSAAVTVTCFSNTDIITGGEKTMGCRLPAHASTPQANLAPCADHPTCRCYCHFAGSVVAASTLVGTGT